MRACLTLLLCLAGACSCLAQATDKTLSERLGAVMTEGLPKNQVNSMSFKKFEGDSTFKIEASRDQKPYAGMKSFDSQGFSTRSFFGVKNPWFGNKVFDTSKADLWSKSTVPNKDQKFATSSANVKAFDQNGKTASLGNNSVETKTYTERGKAQGAMDAEKKNLTIDDVREILNKNH